MTELWLRPVPGPWRITIVITNIVILVITIIIILVITTIIIIVITIITAIVIATIIIIIITIIIFSEQVVNLCKANNWIKPTVYQVLKMKMMIMIARIAKTWNTQYKPSKCIRLPD